MEEERQVAELESLVGQFKDLLDDMLTHKAIWDVMLIDKNISAEALGIAAYLVSMLPYDVVVKKNLKENLMDRFNINQLQVEKIIKELKECGYMSVNAKKDAQGNISQWDVQWTPKGVQNNAA